MVSKAPPGSARAALEQIEELRRGAPVTVTPAQIRAARSLIGWTSSKQLADAAHVGVMTVRRFEEGDKGSDLAKRAMIEALEEAGVEFIPRGVRMRDEPGSAER